MSAMPDQPKGHPTRPIHPMPDFIEEAPNNHGQTDAYRPRPAYQQNGYIGWITRAKRPETKLKRLSQMLDELQTGGIYMRMDHPPSHRIKTRSASSPPRRHQKFDGNQ